MDATSSSEIRAILEFAPHLKRKRERESACTHENCEIDMNAAELSCADCGAEIDPWWYLRRLVQDGEEETQRKQKLLEQEAA